MNRKSYWIGMLLVTGCLLGLFVIAAGNGDVSHAAGTTGTVTADSLNVRSGAGTKYEVLTTISKGTVVTIQETVAVSSSDKWYKIPVTVNGKTVTGYVSATYVAIEKTSQPTTTPNTGASPPKTVTTYRYETTYKAISVPARTLTQTKVYAKAGGARKVIAKKKITLSKKKAVKLTGEKTVKGKKWFKISFSYKKKTRTGYVRNVYVKMTLKSAAAAAVNNVKKSIKIRSAANTKSAYKKSGKQYIRLVKGTAVTITKDVKKGSTKWYKISCTFGGKKKTGYVKASYIRLDRKKVVKKVPVVALSNTDFEKSLNQQGFPDSYKQNLRALHQKYPYWQFVAYKTNLDWNTVINNEFRPGKGVNLISNAKSKAWKSTEPEDYNASTGKWKVYDGSTWVAASRAAVCYYMDPRNFLNERNIFMFESLEYQSQYQTKTGINTILANTPFGGKSFSYKDPDTGKNKTITYTDAFIEAAKKSGVSPYHLASRVKQEVVTSATTTSGAVTGTNTKYPGIYNFYNIGAYSSENPMENGLKWASTGTSYLRPWTDRYRSIVGGGMYIGTSYISKGQNTGYLQKFNVTPYQRYEHQYMTNVEAAYSEAIKTKTAYADTMNKTPIIFSIPVYSNMPAAACAAPK